MRKKIILTERIRKTLAEEKEAYIFLVAYQGQLYTCINLAKDMPQPKYRQSKIFHHMPKTIYSVPYKNDGVKEDYTILSGIYQALGLPDISEVVKGRFNTDGAVKFHSLHDHMMDYNAGIRVLNNNGMYTTSIVYEICDNDKQYHPIERSIAQSDCLEKAIMLTMQNLNMKELDDERLVVSYDLHDMLPPESHLYTLAKNRLGDINKEIAILNKQIYFTKQIPEKSFEM